MFPLGFNVLFLFTSRTFVFINSTAHSLQLVDLTADKHDELLVSAHGTKAGGAGVYAYEIPFDMELLLLPKRVPRHELAVGFEVKHYAPLKGAPGFPMPFYLHGKRAGLGDLPYILLPGICTSCLKTMWFAVVRVTTKCVLANNPF